jgi:hypothetical protein
VGRFLFAPFSSRVSWAYFSHPSTLSARPTWNRARHRRYFWSVAQFWRKNDFQTEILRENGQMCYTKIRTNVL